MVYLLAFFILGALFPVIDEAGLKKKPHAVRESRPHGQIRLKVVAVIKVQTLFVENGIGTVLVAVQNRRPVRRFKESSRSFLGAREILNLLLKPFFKPLEEIPDQCQLGPFSLGKLSPVFSSLSDQPGHFEAAERSCGPDIALDETLSNELLYIEIRNVIQGNIRGNGCRGRSRKSEAE